MATLLRKNKKGQAALFIVLVFQVLFILFAMSLNVAMVVYDKINMQNSLDLAAYYGAKKQAEVLNAMAHINYQMRQNWKLLAWRYRILGTLAQEDGDYILEGKRIQRKFWCPQNKENKTNCDLSGRPYRFDTDDKDINSKCNEVNNIFSRLEIYPDYCDINYFVCISHDVWARGIKKTGNQNLCDTREVRIEPIKELTLKAPFIPEAHIAQATIVNLIDNVNESCSKEGALNWLTVQLFLTHFRLDQKDRKVMIKEIYSKTLQQGKDLDGEDILEGAKKVFFGNLTKANQENVRSFDNYGLTEYNSFENENFKNVFGELYVSPILNYLYSNGSNNESYAKCEAKVSPHFFIEGNSQMIDNQKQITDFLNDRLEDWRLLADLTAPAQKLFPFNMRFPPESPNLNPLISLTLSFFKRPDQTLYYGLTTEFEYKGEHQIFSLNLSSGLKFKGSSFAKAFGGSFGPQPTQHDHLIPTGHPEAPLQFMNRHEDSVYAHQPNYSRWPGDKWGLIDRKLHDPSEESSFLNKQGSYQNNYQSGYKISAYFNNILGGEVPDSLARADGDPKGFIRMMEWMAIYPDLYDVNYYSISANYHKSYFSKICKLLLNGSECQTEGANEFRSPDHSFGSRVFIRGDFGWPDSESYIELNQRTKRIDLSIAPYFLKEGLGPKIGIDHLSPPVQQGDKTQYKYNQNNLIGKHNSEVSNSPPHLTQGNLFYPWLAPGENQPGKLPDGLLSSWFNPKPLDYKNYDFDNQNLSRHFLKCNYTALKNMPVASSCVGLGRTGYSVKLISCDQVQRINPKPPNLDDYCR